MPIDRASGPRSTPLVTADRRLWTVDRLTWLAGGVLGVVAFATSLGFEVVDPRFVEWLLHDDWSIHFLGWHLYRAGPWDVPLGSTPLLRAPLGTSVGLTDSLPLFAVFFKLFDPLLPPTFQYIGLWLLACFVLQGIFAVLLLRLVTPSRTLQLLGAALLVMSPPLLFRVGHPALSMHWLFLAALWRYFGASADKPNVKLLLWWIAIGGIAAATHPYMTLMVFSLMAAAYARRLIVAPSDAPIVLVHLVALAAVAGVLLWQAGYFVIGRTGDLNVVGLGFLSMNTLAPLMSFQRSALFPQDLAEPASPWQFEGFAYLGIGMIALAVVAVGRFLWSLPRRRFTRRNWQHLPFVIVCTILTLLALSPVVTFGPRKLLEYDSGWWGPLTIFRASGRLFWPVFYTMTFAILASVVRLRYRWAVALLVAGVALQAADVRGMHDAARHYKQFAFENPLRSPLWRIATPHYKHLVLVPSNLCDWQGIFDHTPFALLAGELGVSINAGLTARVDTQKQTEYCAQMRRDLSSGAVSPEALYVLRPEVAPRFQEGASSPLVCAPVDGYAICVVADSYRAWQHEFDIPRLALPPRDDFAAFYTELDHLYHVRLQRGAVEAAGSRADRIDAIVKYLALRWAGCNHDDAEAWTIGELGGGTAQRVCLPPPAQRSFPASGDSLRFRTRLDRMLRGDTRRPSEPTHVDPEGEAVWIHAYARTRLEGKSHRDASHEVFQAIAAITGR